MPDPLVTLTNCCWWIASWSYILTKKLVLLLLVSFTIFVRAFVRKIRARRRDWKINKSTNLKLILMQLMRLATVGRCSLSHSRVATIHSRIAKLMHPLLSTRCMNGQSGPVYKAPKTTWMSCRNYFQLLNERDLKCVHSLRPWWPEFFIPRTVEQELKIPKRGS